MTDQNQTAYDVSFQAFIGIGNATVTQQTWVVASSAAEAVAIVRGSSRRFDRDQPVTARESLNQPS